MLKKVTVTNANTGKSSVTIVDTDTHEKAIIGCGIAANETAAVEDITGLDETVHRLSGGGPSVDDRANFFSGLARCLERNIGIVKGLQLQTNRVKSSRYKGVIADLITSMAAGEKLSEAMAKNPDLFPDQVLSLIIAGEEAGQLAKVFRRIGTSERKASKIIKKLKNGLIYPAIVIVLAVVVVIVMSFTLVPAMAKLFETFKAPLPLGTRALIAVSDLLIHQPYMALLPFVGLFYFFKNWGKIASIPWMQDLFLKIPKAGAIVRKSAATLSFRTLAMLVESNVRLSSALSITARASSHYHYRNFFNNVNDHIAIGRSLHEGFLMESHWLGSDARSICGLIELGAETGTGTEMLNEIADDYEEELDSLAGQIDKIMEPLTIMFLGSIVGFLIYAIYGPIFSLGDVILPKKGG
ncbi:MAG: type II secretion system F family protein [Verrucomicrobiaceae bacterium]|nr:type II secretion system F family protein [Verrucomicrobiaceae bacterium]